jgi:hypothetical protein
MKNEMNALLPDTIRSPENGTEMAVAQPSLSIHQAFPNKEIKPMKIGIKSAEDFLSLLVRRKWWVIVPAVALSCIVCDIGSATSEDPMFSESLVLVRPRDVSRRVCNGSYGGTAQQRLRSIQQTVMSRNNTVAILTEFKGKLPESIR